MIKLIAGIDVAYYTKDNKEYGVCVIDVFDYVTFNLVERQISVQKINYPYIPGNLYKRELPIIIGTYEKLNSKVDVYILDGNGYLHQNHEGIATIFSTKTGEKSIGVAKTFYNFANIEYTLENKEFSITPIIIDNEIYGCALRSKENTKPVFVSVGGGLDLDEAVNIVKRCINNESRIPIPTRIADIDTRKERKLILERK